MLKEIVNGKKIICSLIDFFFLMNSFVDYAIPSLNQ